MLGSLCGALAQGYARAWGRWIYDHGLESSSLVVKVPAQRTTFVILANSDGLSRGRRLGDRADVMGSPAATLFMNWDLARDRP